jgi:hypothetical protein
LYKGIAGIVPDNASDREIIYKKTGKRIARKQPAK